MTLRADSKGDLENFGRMLTSQDMIEGQRAFLEKREPQWTGS
jgi:crotonobetainyl-CoA hydratase